MYDNRILRACLEKGWRLTKPDLIADAGAMTERQMEFYDVSKRNTGLDTDNTASNVWADSAYRGAGIGQSLGGRTPPRKAR